MTGEEITGEAQRMQNDWLRRRPFDQTAGVAFREDHIDDRTLTLLVFLVINDKKHLSQVKPGPKKDWKIEDRTQRK